MRLNVYCDLEEDEVYTLSVNGNKKKVDKEHQNVFWELKNKGVYNIRVEKEAYKSNRYFVNWLIYFLTLPIQGLFYFAVFSVCLFNPIIDIKWWKNIKMYSLRAETDMEIDRDINLIIDIKEGKYSELGEVYEKPKINMVIDEKQPLQTKVSYVKNGVSIKNEFTAYLRILGAICGTGTLFFVLMAVVFVKIEIYITMICSFLILMCMIIGFISGVFQYRKYKELIG